MCVRKFHVIYINRGWGRRSGRGLDRGNKRRRRRKINKRRNEKKKK